jgi:epoxyqueuosine reductase
MSLTTELFELARDAGADAAGVAGAEPFEAARHRIAASVNNGMSGPLGFTYQDPEAATDLKKSLPWVQSLFVFGVSYIDSTSAPGETGPVVGRFATRDLYKPVRDVASAVSTRLAGEGARAETLIDDNRLVDRAAAVRAGVGWLGRSTMVLAPGSGPWMLLGTVATDVMLDRSDPMKRDCGTCTACIPACPTGAITDGVLDARRCLSTWLQTPGSIPHWIRPRLGRRIYGCDDCLTSCPPGQPSLRQSGVEASNWSFEELLALDDHALLNRFSWWFVPRRDGRYLRRNILVAAGNSREKGAHGKISGHLSDTSSMIRGHAAWAVARSGQPDASTLLRQALREETTPEGRDELALALIMLRQPELYDRILEEDERVATDPGLVALGLIGDTEHPDRPERDLRLVTFPQSSLPSATEAELAGLIRVNDRDRVLERVRRRARAGPP